MEVAGPDQHPRGFSLQVMCAQHLGLFLDKTGQTADYSQVDLPSNLFEYQALDCFVTLQLYLKLMQMDPREKANKLQPGTPAILTTGGGRIDCAEVQIEFMGDGIELRKWGVETIGKNHALVCLVRVLSPGTKIPISFKPPPMSNKESENLKALDSKTTLLIDVLKNKQHRQPIIAVPKKSLKVLVRDLPLPDAQGTMAAMTAATTAPTKAPMMASMKAPTMATTMASTTAPTMAARIGRPTMAATKAAMTAPLAATMMASTTAPTMATTTAPTTDATMDSTAASTMAATTMASTMAATMATTLASTTVPTTVPTSTTAATVTHAATNAPAAPTIAPTTLDLFDGYLVDAVDWDCADSVEVEPPIRSRQKSDLFHEFQDLPLSKKCPARQTIIRLIIQASFLFDQTDYKPWLSHLAKKHHIFDQVRLLENFYHNKEKWRRHVRMYTPTAADHGDRIDKVKVFAAKHLSKWYTSELEVFFDKFAKKARVGEFEELPDVALFQHDGQDRYGLDLWLRNRGSTKAENFHQKLHVAFGPWSIGARTGHYLMQLVASRYNVNTAIRRHNAHTFGHAHLYLIDEIDLLARELYQVILWERHPNSLLFKAVPGVTSVGIVPLLHESNLVVAGAPHPSLKGDLLFMAQKMHVQCPPLPFGSPQEYRMFTDFMQKHPKPSARDALSFCLSLKNEVDFKTVFPKTVPLFKSHYNHWKDGQLIRCVNHGIKSAFDPFLWSLAKPVDASSTRASTTMVAKVMPLHDPDRVGEIKGAEMNVVGAHSEPMDDVCAPSSPGRLQAPTLAVAKPGVVPTTTHHSTEVVKKCFYWPVCKNCASRCGGQRQGKCARVNSGKLVVPANFAQLKDKAQKEEKRKRIANRRAAEKAAKRQNTAV
jgi:hypothetical protein